MPFIKHPSRFWFAIALALSACTTVEKPFGTSDSGKEGTTQPARTAAYSGRQGAAKPTPFADDEASRTVYFASSDATIDSQGAEVLRQNAQKLKEDAQLVVVLVGHTDNLGSSAYNLAVADRRIEAVSDRLRSLGVARNQIRRLPVGSEESRKLKCDSEACRRSMRRVELIYERR
jgi:peptidoglycan-associated lipoprotein